MTYRHDASPACSNVSSKARTLLPSLYLAYVNCLAAGIKGSSDRHFLAGEIPRLLLVVDLIGVLGRRIVKRKCTAFLYTRDGTFLSIGAFPFHHVVVGTHLSTLAVHDLASKSAFGGSHSNESGSNTKY